MKITIISIGKFENSPHKNVFELYLKRLKWSVELKEIELKKSNNLSIDQTKKEEAKLIEKFIKQNSFVIALDGLGKQFSSKNFADFIKECALNRNSHLTFLIGGSNGLHESLILKANAKISFSLMTFPHLMARSILIEQLYRAQSIIECHPYHK